MKAVSELTNLHRKGKSPRVVISFKFTCPTQENLVIVLPAICNTAWMCFFSLGFMSITGQIHGTPEGKGTGSSYSGCLKSPGKLSTKKGILSTFF